MLFNFKGSRTETLTHAYVSAGYHEDAIPAVMECARILRGHCNMRLDYFPDKKAVLSDEARIGELAFEIGVALRDQRRGDLATRHCSEFEFCELIHVRACGVAYADHDILYVDGWDVGYAFPAAPKHFETVVALEDVTTDKRGLKLHHRNASPWS